MTSTASSGVTVTIPAIVRHRGADQKGAEHIEDGGGCRLSRPCAPRRDEVAIALAASWKPLLSASRCRWRWRAKVRAGQLLTAR